MAKYALINCYSDNNKGDLGIILSTVDYISKNDPNSCIIGVSTYNNSDPLFQSEHQLLRKSIPVYPSLFGELNIGRNKDILSKLIRFIIDTFRLFLFLILPKSLGIFLCFNKAEKKTLKEIQESDYIVSKGGSFICNERSARDRIALIRFLFIFLVSFKLNKKVIVLAQSLGPVYGVLSRKYVNYVLNKCNKIVIRENTCKTKYTYLDYPQSKEIVLNDIAFYLKPENENLENNIKEEMFNIGFTIKYVDDNSDKYKNMMTKSINHILKTYRNIYIYIFPHVTIDYDHRAALEIYERIDDSIKERISIYTGDYTANELKYLYSKMKMFVGTRLHSTIFAMGEQVPSVCIAYHGTKAQGIMKNMESLEYTVIDYSEEKLIYAFDKLYNNLDEHKKILANNLEKYKNLFDQYFNVIFD